MEKINKEIFKDLTILYVEDDLMTLEEISFFLKKYVKKLICAKNGEEGLELFKKHNPDMIITDIQMPVMNGLQMAEKIFSLSPEVPIALTTAYSESNYLMKAIELGIDKYIVKPLDMLEILAVIQKSMQLNFMQNQIAAKNEYIQFILDTNPSFMFIMHSNEVEYVNQKLLDILGYSDMKSLQEQMNICNDLVELENVKTDKNWIDYIIENADKKHLVHLRNKNCDNFFPREFYVSYKKFENIEKSIFLFSDNRESKLEKVNELTLRMLSKITSDGSSNTLTNDLNTILKETNKNNYLN